ncbi:unnamed protein product [Echinostoma caproni]|uniref:Uncharacterized protein n=1 Tax=Echinostoma caproni TaxID=27848 RepID=A0A183A7Y4_9TREM|nr:unnamed protein product [Echinostoma caproni]
MQKEESHTQTDKGAVPSTSQQPQQSTAPWWWWSASRGRNEISRSDKSSFVINSSDMYQSAATLQLLDPQQAGKEYSERSPVSSFHSAAQLHEEDISQPTWCTRNMDKDKEISQFVIFLLSRYTVSINPLQIYSIIYEWERYQHQRQLALHRQWTQRMRQQKRRQRRLEEYNRHLRHFASVLAQQHMNQLRKARTFGEFKQIMFDRITTDTDSDHVIEQPHSLQSSALIESSLRYPDTEHNIVAAASTALEFPGGAGGGIVVNSLRSTRKGSTRESRAIVELPSTASTESLVTVSAKSSQIEQPESVDGDRSVPDSSIHRLLPDEEEEAPKYSEAELRSAFESYQEFRRSACQPRNQTLCVRSLLDLQQEHTTVIIPRGFHVRRCGSQIQPVCSYHRSTIQTELDREESDMGMSEGNRLDGAGPTTYRPDESGGGGNPGSDWYGYPHSSASIAEAAEHLEYAMDRGQYSSCECETAEEECLPTNVTLKIQAVAVSRVRSTNQGYSMLFSIIFGSNSRRLLPWCITEVFRFFFTYTFYRKPKCDGLREKVG